MDRTFDSPADMPPEDRVETPMGAVTFGHLDTTAVRVSSGRNVGWLRLRGESLYATAMFRMEGDAWTIDARHSAVRAVVDDKAAGPVAPDLEAEAFKVLEEAFGAWREARPDIAARVALVERTNEAYQTQARIKEVAAHLRRLRGGMADLRRGVEEAEAAVQEALASMEPDAAPAP